MLAAKHCNVWLGKDEMPPSWCARFKQHIWPETVGAIHARGDNPEFKTSEQWILFAPTQHGVRTQP